MNLRQEEDFQSPFHWVNPCNVSQEGAKGGLVVQAFQSPFHWVSSCNFKYFLILQEQNRNSFNPLFIGLVLATQSRVLGRMLFLKHFFQSPFHWVSPCNELRQELTKNLNPKLIFQSPFHWVSPCNMERSWIR